MTSASELLEERAALLVRLDEINASLKMLESPARPVEIWTRRNLRNTYINVAVYDDKELTILAPLSAHGGFIAAEDAARLLDEGVIDGDFIEIIK